MKNYQRTSRFDRILRRLREEREMILSAHCKRERCPYCDGEITLVPSSQGNYYVLRGVINPETLNHRRFPLFQCRRCDTYFDEQGVAIQLRAGPQGLLELVTNSYF